ncbi:MAG: inorganic phosphate transporter [Mailhella sp.]|nr:inorganic phosphate transporter [Mailhella sp.]
MPDISLLLVLIVLVALLFDFTNGMHDCANVISTVVSTKALTPQAAVIMTVSLELLGALLGSHVAATLGSGIVHPQIVSGSRILVLAALFAAVFWNLVTWYFGIPSSSSHALIGGLIGSGLAYGGFEALNGSSILAKVIIPIFAAPLLGFAVGFIVMGLITAVFWHKNRAKCNSSFKKMQIVGAMFMATTHGMNDAQKTMGIIALALFTFGEIPEVSVPLWVKISCASVMALGMGSGGWKIIKTMGTKIFKMETVHGFAVEAAATLVIGGASAFGMPISTTHVITTSIFGVGAMQRLSAVHWGIAGNLVVAWVLTLPISAAIGWICYMLLKTIGAGV